MQLTPPPLPARQSIADQTEVALLITELRAEMAESKQRRTPGAAWLTLFGLLIALAGTPTAVEVAKRWNPPPPPPPPATQDDAETITNKLEHIDQRLQRGEVDQAGRFAVIETRLDGHEDAIRALTPRNKVILR